MSSRVFSEDGPRVLDVAGDLRGQRARVAELLLAAEPGHEAELQALLVEVAVEVEQVGLDPQLGLAEGRPDADADRGLVHAGGAVGPAGVDAAAPPPPGGPGARVYR